MSVVIDGIDGWIVETRRYLEDRIAGTSQPWLVGASTETPLDLLFRRFAMTDHERAVIALLLAHEVCPESRRLLRELNTETVAEPTLDVVRRLVFGGSPTELGWDLLSMDGQLQRYGFIERTDKDPQTPEHRQTLALGRRVLELAHGKLRLDPTVAAFASVEDRGPASAELLIDPDTVDALARGCDEANTLVIAHGAPGSGRRSLLLSLASERGHRILVVDGHAIDKDRAVARRQLRAIARECRLLGLVPLVRDLDALDGDQDRLSVLDEELPGFVLATSVRAISRRWSKPICAVEVPGTDGATRAKLWKRALPAASLEDAEHLSALYPLSPSLIHAVGAASIRACRTSRMEPEHIQAGLRSVLDERLSGLATRVTVKQRWNDLVLPTDQATAVVEFLARVRHRNTVYETWGFADKVGRGLGVTALFSGPPGTGKTMCAGLIARELSTELYQVDLSRIASKWIGETEKNLARLFDAAESAHAILLFDEADAVFGKRTSVTSSNDRHSNNETNYLLQRLETFGGICILTTNHENAIDEAFRRRIALHVRLPMPDVDERQRLWSALIPESAPTVGELGLEKLAEKYAMTGGYIRNAVLRAAFLAANERGAISGAHLRRAAQLEYEAMGKLSVG